MIFTNPGRVILPPLYRCLAEAYYNFEFRSDDVVLSSYTKSGTVWCKEILWAMTHLDQLHLADHQHIDDRNYFIDKDMLMPFCAGDGRLMTERFSKECPGAKEEEGVAIQLAAAHTGSPRFISSHLPFSLLNPSLLDTCKVVYVARNPKDVCFSCYNFYSNLGNMETNLEGCAELFMKGDLVYGQYWEHLRQAWQRKSHPNLHIMFYEDMKADLISQLTILDSFLGLGINRDDLVRVADHTSFEKMKSREASIPIVRFQTAGGSFFHGGKVGGWSNNATADLDAKIDAWITHNSRDLQDIYFRYAAD
ncbi:hypothetical protein Pmani_005488 [Petrolisthes manimaculis]|uniref:Sulfotransferase domain-containing protein n=1 Tax=Petrolisthes manimaculis TaxID=1843537 RepID=A0AAE1QDQ8_9EUCA|nr:hypothetical protein Pmani_005488 [Petrolisthes manimaculis]